MNILTYNKILLVLVSVVACTLEIHGSTTNTIAYPSEYAVAVKNEKNHSFLSPDSRNTNIYTVTKGTTLVFEVNAQILSREDSGVLSSEWYNSKQTNDGKPLLLLGWWWWVDGKKNHAAPKQIPNKPNTPNALPNTGKKGLFVFEQTFDKVTPEDSPAKITAVLYPVKEGQEYPPAVVEFFVNVNDTNHVL